MFIQVSYKSDLRNFFSEYMIQTQKSICAFILSEH
jgi:hypothetical protein